MKVANTSLLYPTLCLFGILNNVHSFSPLPTLTSKIHQSALTVPRTLVQSWGQVNHNDNDMTAKDFIKSNYENEQRNQKIVMNENERRKSTDPVPFFYQMFQKVSKKQNLAAAVASIALVLTLTMTSAPLPSDAAMSGGRMGGSYSSTRTMPSRSPSYSRGYSGGYSPGYSYGGPRVVAPIMPIAPITPVVPYTPFYGGAGVMTYSRGPDIFSLMFLGFFVFAAASIFNFGNTVSETASSVFNNNDSRFQETALGSGTSVIQLSVAMEVPNRDDPNSILSVFDRLSRSARTDSRVGIQNLTSQVALELLRRKSSIVAASSSYNHFNDRQKAKREYQTMSIRERSKFEKETVSKYGGVDYSNPGSRGNSADAIDKATMVVVTLLVAIDGDSTKIPKSISSIKDVETALNKIASDSKVDDCLQTAEILWTPEERTETLTYRDVVADYPELRSI